MKTFVLCSLATLALFAGCQSNYSDPLEGYELDSIGYCNMLRDVEKYPERKQYIYIMMKDARITYAERRKYFQWVSDMELDDAKAKLWKVINED